MKKSLLCPCTTTRSYSQCCEPYHLREQIAETPEILMRTRYSAYALNKMDYVAETWHHTTKPHDLHDIAPLKWINLKIVSFQDEGFVEFIATYKTQNGKAHKMHEKSRFVKEDGRWFYIDGIID